MNPAEMLQASFETTQIVRERKYSLFTFGITKLPYFFIARSQIDSHDSLVREGKVIVEKPQIIIPGNNPLFEGFEFQDGMSFNESEIPQVLLTRRIKLPSLRYINKESSISVDSIGVDEKINQICNKLESKPDTVTGVIHGEDKFYPFPLLIYVGAMILRSSGDNLKEMLEKGWL